MKDWNTFLHDQRRIMLDLAKDEKFPAGAFPKAMDAWMTVERNLAAYFEELEAKHNETEKQGDYHDDQDRN